MDHDAIWTPHLQPGERIVWSASASASLRARRLIRRRVLFGLAFLASALIALLFLARLMEAVASAMTAPTLGAAIIPLYLVFALTMAALSAWGVRRAIEPLHRAVQFAATDRRVVSLDRDGALVDEIAAADIDHVVAGGASASPDIYILRRDDPREARVFAIEHIERPLDAKTIIERSFLPPDRPEATRSSGRETP